MNRAERAAFNKELLEKGVTIVAVSKTKPVSQILEMYEEGFRDFGENRVQELVSKQPELPDDIRWHMIGNFQKNKVKYLASFVHLIHSVSSIGLLKTINKEAIKNNRQIPILLQVKIAAEDTKSGLEKSDLEVMLANLADGMYPNVLLQGFMGMATFTADVAQVRQEFRGLKEYAHQLLQEFPGAFDLPETGLVLSMGMSGDYEVAIEEGANMVRIGSLLFGPRF